MYRPAQKHLLEKGHGFASLFLSHLISCLFSYTLALIPFSVLLDALMIFETSWGYVSCSISVSLHQRECEMIRESRVGWATVLLKPYCPKKLWQRIFVCARSPSKIYNLVTKCSSKKWKLNYVVWNLFCYLETWVEHGQTTLRWFIFSCWYFGDQENSHASCHPRIYHLQ